MADSSHIHRPIPRRPFDLNRRDPTPPPDGDSPAPGTPYHNLNLQTPSRSSGPGLSPSSTFNSEGTNDTDTTLSRATSFLNLQKKSEDERRPPTDWSLVLRAITAFLGIVFAIRKLAWTSTMQISLYLAVVNPFLWYLIDRSKTGFLLSAAFSCTASAVLMGLDPDLMPVPTMRSPLRNATRAYRAEPSPALPFSFDTAERALWIVSVLFCSCLIFGNIGRRMGLDRSAYSRGRWAGVR
ncbi:hypothetical protein BR93DRAFT_418128 [Coniochaeta sp. PMI_546]|nr:hypothetical protein BR93DRAFT_418128 [Coniochaeta sp. PMI_546]